MQDIPIPMLFNALQKGFPLQITTKYVLNEFIHSSLNPERSMKSSWTGTSIKFTLDCGTEIEARRIGIDWSTIGYYVKNGDTPWFTCKVLGSDTYKVYWGEMCIATVSMKYESNEWTFTFKYTDEFNLYMTTLQKQGESQVSSDTKASLPSAKKESATTKPKAQPQRPNTVVSTGARLLFSPPPKKPSNEKEKPQNGTLDLGKFRAIIEKYNTEFKSTSLFSVEKSSPASAEMKALSQLAEKATNENRAEITIHEICLAVKEAYSRWLPNGSQAYRLDILMFGKHAEKRDSATDLVLWEIRQLACDSGCAKPLPRG